MSCACLSYPPRPAGTEDSEESSDSDSEDSEEEEEEEEELDEEEMRLLNMININKIDVKLNFPKVIWYSSNHFQKQIKYNLNKFCWLIKTNPVGYFKQIQDYPDTSCHFCREPEDSRHLAQCPVYSTVMRGGSPPVTCHLSPDT